MQRLAALDKLRKQVLVQKDVVSVAAKSGSTRPSNEIPIQKISNINGELYATCYIYAWLTELIFGRQGMTIRTLKVFPGCQ